jgi:hypothetical protein
MKNMLTLLWFTGSVTIMQQKAVACTVTAIPIEGRLPNERTFVHVHRCLREGERFPTNTRLVGNVVQDVGIEETVLNRFAKDPRTSTRSLAREFGVSQSYVSRLTILFEYKP